MDGNWFSYEIHDIFAYNGNCSLYFVVEEIFAFLQIIFNWFRCWLSAMFAWISLSINEYGYVVVSNLFYKLLYLSGENIFAKGPFTICGISLCLHCHGLLAIHPLVYGIRN